MYYSIIRASLKSNKELQNISWNYNLKIQILLSLLFLWPDKKNYLLRWMCLNHELFQMRFNNFYVFCISFIALKHRSVALVTTFQWNVIKGKTRILFRGNTTKNPYFRLVKQFDRFQNFKTKLFNITNIDFGWIHLYCACPQNP